MLYIVTISLVAIALDLLLLLAWRYRKRTGKWPAIFGPSIREQVATRCGQLRALLSDWFQPSIPARQQGWRDHIAEFSLAAAIILIVLLVVLSRSGPPPSEVSQPLPPWLVWIYTLRQSVVTSSLTWAMLMPLVLAGLLTFAASRRDAQVNTRRMAGLGLVLVLAVEAQVALVAQSTVLGVVLYLVMAAALWRWWRVFGSDIGGGWWASQLSGRTEMVIVGIIFLISGVARLYGIGAYPFGVEGDESKWTVEVVRWMLDGVEQFSAHYHFTSLPVSFYMQAPFHYLLGPGILAARTTVALASTLAGLLFYFLLRRTTGQWVALVAFFLLAVSPADIMASRLANVESHVKLWAVLPLFFLFLGFDQLKTAWFALAGISLGLALLTYDTLAPILGLVAVLFVVEAIRNRKAGIIWVKGFLAISIPLAFALPSAYEYLTGRGPYYDLASKGWEGVLFSRLFVGLSDLLNNIFLQARADFLFVRQGPLLEGIIAPFFVMGIVIALLRIRTRGPLMLLLWFFLFTIPVPVILDSPMFRVLYPGWPAFYGLAALAIVLCGSILWLPLMRQRTVQIAMVFPAILLVVNNFYIFRYDLVDPDDRVRRRLAAELVMERVGAGDVVFTPYLPNAGDVLDDEQSLIRLYLRSKIPLQDLDTYYRPVEVSQLLHALSVGYSGGEASVITYEDTTAVESDTPPTDQTLARCFGAQQIRQEAGFSVFAISAGALQKPACIAPVLKLGLADQPAQKGGPMVFDWESDYPLTRPSLACQMLRPDTFLLQASDFEIGPGWTFESRFAPIPAGESFLAEGLGSRTATTSLNVGSPGTFAVWVLSYRRHADEWPAMVEAAGQSLTVPVQPDDLNQWIWKRAGTLDASGNIQIALRRPYAGADRDFVSLFIYKVLLTRQLDFNPTLAGIWSPEFDLSIPASDSTSGTYQHAFESGTYQCSLVAMDDPRLTNSWGEAGATSPPIEFRVAP